MIHAQIEASITPRAVWNAWSRAFELRGTTLSKGVKSKGIVRYKVLEVDAGKSYSILWKSFLIGLVYTYKVSKSEKGSLIQVSAKPKGLFSWMGRLMLKKKLQRELDSFLKDFVAAMSKH